VCTRQDSFRRHDSYKRQDAYLRDMPHPGTRLKMRECKRDREEARKRARARAEREGKRECERENVCCVFKSARARVEDQ
jgi:hypothetical protein